MRSLSWSFSTKSKEEEREEDEENGRQRGKDIKDNTRESAMRGGTKKE